MEATEVFKALSDRTRLRIVSLLARYHGLSVSHLVLALGVPQWHVSRHLQRLRRVGIVRSDSSGTWRHYSIRDDVRKLVRSLLAAVAERVDAQLLRQDLERLRAMLQRPRKAPLPSGAAAGIVVGGFRPRRE